MVSTLLLYLGSALNPITYNIFSDSFRQGFWELYTSFVGYWRTLLLQKISHPGLDEARNKGIGRELVTYQVALQE